jgi:hypothetical protein
MPSRTQTLRAINESQCLQLMMNFLTRTSQGIRNPLPNGREIQPTSGTFQTLVSTCQQGVQGPHRTLGSKVAQELSQQLVWTEWVRAYLPSTIPRGDETQLALAIATARQEHNRTLIPVSRSNSRSNTSSPRTPTDAPIPVPNAPPAAPIRSRSSRSSSSPRTPTAAAAAAAAAAPTQIQANNAQYNAQLIQDLLADISHMPTAPSIAQQEPNGTSMATMNQYQCYRFCVEFLTRTGNHMVNPLSGRLLILTSPLCVSGFVRIRSLISTPGLAQTGRGVLARIAYLE